MPIFDKPLIDFGKFRDSAIEKYNDYVKIEITPDNDPQLAFVLEPNQITRVNDLTLAYTFPIEYNDNYSARITLKFGDYSEVYNWVADGFLLEDVHILTYPSNTSLCGIWEVL